MLEGIGAQTIAALTATIVTGEVTPLDCYVGLGYSTDGAVELSQPVGVLGCEYDIENVRLFFDHLSSPASSSDYPGMNHTGIKLLLPTDFATAYAGVSFELGGLHELNPGLLKAFHRLESHEACKLNRFWNLIGSLDPAHHVGKP